MYWFALLLVSSASALHTGMSGAGTQNMMNYVVGQVLPVGLDFLRHYPLPNPLASGSKASISWKVEDATIKSVNAAAKFTLINPNIVQLTVYNLSLDFTAKVHARENVWPHPSITAKAEAKTSDASASAALGMDLVNGVPKVNLTSCDLKINLKVTITGLGIFDKIADLIVKSFKGTIEKLMKKAICEDMLATALVKNFLNPFLANFHYQKHLPIAAPFNQAILDYHLTQRPEVNNGFLRMAITGEVFSADGRHDPDPVDPLPVVDPSVWASRMVSMEVGPLPFNSIVWTFYTQKLLTFTAKKSDLPPSIAPILNTAFYKTLIPKLYEAFPNTDMLVTVYAASQPTFKMLDGHLTASCNLSYAFEVITKDKPQLAFVLWSPFEITMHVGMKGNYIVGGLDNVTVTVKPGDCPFGILGPEIISALSVPVNLLVNLILIPILNNFVSQGVLLPSFEAPMGSIATIYGNFVRPELLLKPGYILIATDLNLTIIEKKTGLPFPL